MKEESITECADIISKLGCTKSAEQLTIFTNMLAIAISKGKTSDQLNVIGNFVVSLGSLILTIAAQVQTCESKVDKLQQIRQLKKQIQELEDSLC